jgi:RNA polymerase sigma factor (sigma-70 family)
MRLIKTKQTERTTYTYTFTDTDEKGKQFIRKQTLRPGEDGVTEMDIKMLHSMDDHEVYINIKNLRPEMTDKEKAEQATWIEWFKSDFFIKYGYEPTKDDIKAAVSERYPKNWVMSLNLFESDDDGGDTSDRHEELADPNAFVDPDDSLPSDVRRMREIVSGCTDKQREAYRLVYIEGYTEKEAAKIMGCTQQGVHKHISLVVKKIKEKF